MIIMTIMGFIIVLDMSSWKVVFNYPHAIVANPTIWMAILVAVGGIVAKMSRDKSGER